MGDTSTDKEVAEFSFSKFSSISPSMAKLDIVAAFSFSSLVPTAGSMLLIIFPIPSTPTSSLSPHEPTMFDVSSLSSIFVASQSVSTLYLELTFFVAFLLSSLTPTEVSSLSSALPLYSELVFSVFSSVSSLILTEGSILTSGLPLLSFPI